MQLMRIFQWLLQLYEIISLDFLRKFLVTHCKAEVVNLQFSDPLYPLQWHLQNNGQVQIVQSRIFNGIISLFYFSHFSFEKATLGNDVHIRDVWSRGIYGTGVTIAIVDDGVQGIHPDLQCNYVPQDSFDFDLGTSAQVPLETDDHGTSCAGVAAARDNHVCGVGAAFRASIAGIRVLGPHFSDSSAASALSYHRDRIHIYSNSWGPSDGILNKLYINTHRWNHH